MRSENLGLTRRWLTHEHDESEAAILGSILASHPTFLEKANRLATIASPTERRTAAHHEAAAYVAKSGPRRDAIAALLLVVSECSPRERSTRVASIYSKGVWADDGRPSERRRQRIRERWDMLERGAHRLASLGAGECIECGVELSDLYERLGASRKRRRRRYCAMHDGLSELWVAGVHEHEMRSALDAATGQHRLRLHRRHGTSLS